MKEFYLYRLIDANGNRSFVILNDLADNGTIGGIDDNGIYQQFDSYEMYHAYAWAEKHGMKLDIRIVKLNADKIFLENQK